uniref:Uncharacterized protein n=1 Tax=Romanomermis culicivorax TaxID=13658 RepID=A0A915JB19_ROMCU
MQSDYRFLSTLYGKYGNYDYDDQFLIFLAVIRETGRNKKTTFRTKLCYYCGRIGN